MQQVKWFDRRFSFTPDQNVFPSTLERLWGTPVRLSARINFFITSRAASLAEDSQVLDKFGDPKVLSWQPIDDPGTTSWSIKENIGHLTDLESLWWGRLEDILSGKEYLREWDLENGLTHEAKHNSFPLDRLVADFTESRQHTLTLLRPLTEADLQRSALHPRLHQPLRLADLFHFVAEHDDHHLARIAAIFRMSSG